MMPSFAFYDESGNVIATHEHAGDFKEWGVLYSCHVALAAKITFS
jgi:hypothetical protein